MRAVIFWLGIRYLEVVIVYFQLPIKLHDFEYKAFAIGLFLLDAIEVMPWRIFKK